jgi:alpha-glucosidase (family GH31 glycosyl hydrolase)
MPQTDSVAFSIMGSSVDIYLMPAATAFEGLRVHWALTGAAALPPRYAFGFMACRWGWQNESYIEDMLGRFRTGEFPIDAWISDFEWYTPEPDYSLAPGGTDAFKDFDFDRNGDCRPGQVRKRYPAQNYLVFPIAFEFSTEA